MFLLVCVGVGCGVREQVCPCVNSDSSVNYFFQALLNLFGRVFLWADFLFVLFSTLNQLVHDRWQSLLTFKWTAFASAHHLKCQICKYCLVLHTINSCFRLYPQMLHPAKGSSLALGLASTCMSLVLKQNAEFVQNLLKEIWGSGMDLYHFQMFPCTVLGVFKRVATLD